MRRLSVLAVAVFVGLLAFGEVVDEIDRSSVHGSVSALAFSPGGSLLAVAGMGSHVRIVRPTNGIEIRRLPVPFGGISALAFNHTGKRLAAGLTNQIIIWHSLTGEVDKHLKASIGRVTAMMFSPDGSLLAVCSSDRYVHLLETESFSETKKLSTGGVIARTLDFSPEGDQLLIGCGVSLLVWQIHTDIPPARIRGHKGQIVGAAFSPAGDRAFSAAHDQKLLVWDIVNGTTMGELSDQGGRFSAMAVGDEGGLLATGAKGKTIMVRRADTGEALHQIGGLPREPDVLALSRDGRVLACGMRSPGDTLALWQLDPHALHAGEGIVFGGDIDAPYLTRFERKVLAEQNLARTDPRAYVEFARRHRRRFSGKSFRNSNGAMVETQEGTAVVDEAIAFLEKVRPCPALTPSSGLSLAAADHVKDTGPPGIAGHTGTDGSQPVDRIGRHGKWQGLVGENIAYGIDDARAIVLQLIIDDGVLDRGHRKNIFNRDYRVSGIHTGDHAEYGSMCVITYAGRFKE